MRRYLQAFTLIELLIVVAIIAILAAIAVPNFLEAQVRSKVAKVNNDLRTLATAIESYAVDNNSYPMHMLIDQTRGDNIQDPWIPVNPNYSGTPGTNNEFHFSHLPGLSITTPIAYISSYPEDPFHMAGMPINGPEGGGPTTDDSVIGREYLYGNSEHGARPTNVATLEAFQVVYGAWRAWSGGPGFTRRAIYLRGSSKDSMVPYDATNGTVSAGAIWRTQRSPDGGRPILPGVVD